MNRGQVVIQVSGASKKFSRSLGQSVRYGVEDIAHNLAGMRARSGTLRDGEFWAVDDLSFEVHKGETVGIIGANGSGKSTTLKMLNGIYMPDRGRITVTGRVGALIELEAGFHPMLSGWENIYVNAAILGLSKRKVDGIIDEIVEFSGIGDFIHSPVKYYSSGMRARLGFSIAMYVDPDILLVDEVLSVGDATFRSKSYERMLNFRRRGKTLCFVSHDIMGVTSVCDRVVWLDHGRKQKEGTIDEVIPAYLHFSQKSLLEEKRTSITCEETGEVTVTGVETRNQHGPTGQFRFKDRLIVRLSYHAFRRISRPYLMLYVIAPQMDQHVFNANMLRDGGEPEWLEPGPGWIDVDFGDCNLYPGTYRLVAGIRKNSVAEYCERRDIGSFDVVSTREEYGKTGRFAADYLYDPSCRLVVPVKYRWGFDGVRADGDRTGE